MKEINYEPKNTTARTQYNKISKNDMLWLTNELTKYVTLMGELRNHKDSSYSALANQFWSSIDNKLPKGTNGTNTPESFVCGMLNNLLYGTQYDLSDIQMSSLEYISSLMHSVYEAVRKLGLQPKTIQFEEITFRQSLFTL